MQRISTKVWSHQSSSSGEKKYVSDVLSSEPKQVDSFRDLVRVIAEISFHNPEFVLFYRGQAKDYKKNLKEKDPVSSFYPTIYRKRGASLTSAELKERFERLDALSDKLREQFSAQEISGHDKLAKFPELAWAILQHYEVCPTPLIDVTHSLRVAASFALNDHEDDGYLYVFGLPHPNGSVSYSVDLELLNIRLLSICPPEANRPFFQEGFLVGSFPSRRYVKHPSLDLGVRLIAKFRLMGRRFWDVDFHAIPYSALYPTDDRVEEICKNLTS